MRLLILFLGLGLLATSQARDFHLDSRLGNDSNDGKTAETAWKSLDKANEFEFAPGDRLLLKRGSRFKGGLKLRLKGTPDHPIVIETYGEGSAPVIDAKGHEAGVHLQGSHHVVVRDLDNNVFHIMGKTEDVIGDQNSKTYRHAGGVQRVRMENNLYYSDSVLPESLPFSDSNGMVGDPRFKKPGGLETKDYIPRNTALVKDKGRVISRLEGDEVGLRIGLEVKEDFFGNPIVGKPDIGAVEVN